MVKNEICNLIVSKNKIRKVMNFNVIELLVLCVTVCTVNLTVSMYIVTYAYGNVYSIRSK